MYIVQPDEDLAYLILKDKLTGVKHSDTYELFDNELYLYDFDKGLYLINTDSNKKEHLTVYDLVKRDIKFFYDSNNDNILYVSNNRYGLSGIDIRSAYMVVNTAIHSCSNKDITALLSLKIVPIGLTQKLSSYVVEHGDLYYNGALCMHAITRFNINAISKDGNNLLIFDLNYSMFRVIESGKLIEKIYDNSNKNRLLEYGFEV